MLNENTCFKQQIANTQQMMTEMKLDRQIGDVLAETASTRLKSSHVSIPAHS